MSRGEGAELDMAGLDKLNAEFAETRRYAEIFFEGNEETEKEVCFTL